MIQSVYNKITSTLVLMLLLIYSVKAGIAVDSCKINCHEIVKAFHYEIPFVQGGEIELSNKYGRLEIHTWDKAEVLVDVSITVKSNSKSTAQEKMDNISIEIDHDGDYLQIETVFEDSDNSWWNSLWGNCNSSAEVNYTIFLPKSSHLSANNKYGNTTIEEINNDLVADIKYGDLVVGKVGGSVQLYVGYGKASFQDIGDLTAEVDYGTLQVESAGKVELDSKYSKCYIQKCRDITSTSKYDSYNLGEIGDFVNEGKYDAYKINQVRSVIIDSKYSELKIMMLEKSLDANMDNGSIKIHETSAVLEDIAIESKYTDIYLNIPGDYKYFFESRYGSPQLKAICVNETVERDGSYQYLKGYKGNPKSSATVSINTKYGSIKID